MRERKTRVYSHFHPHPCLPAPVPTEDGAGRLSLPPAYRQAGIQGEGRVWVYSKGRGV